MRAGGSTCPFCREAMRPSECIYLTPREPSLMAEHVGHAAKLADLKLHAPVYLGRSPTRRTKLCAKPTHSRTTKLYDSTLKRLSQLAHRLSSGEIVGLDTMLDDYASGLFVEKIDGGAHWDAVMARIRQAGIYAHIDNWGAVERFLVRDRIDPKDWHEVLARVRD